MIVVCAQMVKNESKWKWKHPYISITKRMKSLPSARLAYDYVFSWTNIIVTCVVVINVRYTIFVQVGLAMTMSIKLLKPFLMIKISIRHQVWQGKRWETSFWTCVPFFKTIVVIVSRNVSWVIIRSFPQGHRSKWILISLMVWPH